MMSEEVLSRIKKLLDEYDKEWEEITLGNAVLEMRYESMWLGFVDDVREILKETDE